MTLLQLRTAFRTMSDDTLTPYFWSDADILRHLNEAQVEACFRKRLLIDSTSSFTQIAISAPTSVYNLDAKIIFIRRVKLTSATVPLAAADYRDMDKSYHGWDSQTGTIERYITGLDPFSYPKKLRLYRIPTASATAALVVVREPTTALSVDGDSPEIQDFYHEKLLHWPLYRGYSNHDAEIYDAELAAKHLALFEAVFGTREAAEEAEMQLQRANANRFAYCDGTF
jgi:hypothetical protein